MKTVIVLLLLAVLATLAGAGFVMLRRRDKNGAQNPKAMARVLALRVGLSVSVFILVLVAWSAGWIKPTGIPLQ